jgi:hypothetical protein
MRNKNFPVEWKKGDPPSLPYLIRQEKGLKKINQNRVKKINKVEPKVFKKIGKYFKVLEKFRKMLRK